MPAAGSQAAFIIGMAHTIMPPHIIMHGMPPAIMPIIRWQASLNASAGMPSSGIILQLIVPSVPISQDMRHIIIGIMPICGIMLIKLGIMLAIIGGIMLIMLGIMLAIMGGIMPIMLGIMPGIIMLGIGMFIAALI
ncbi:MAG: hypothetical protein JO122_00680 [Acetobacteraceae bacterium]|nr:hypothetical protein [Acetobacteraceae bacterium]